ncbi:hypothetical protein DEU56DRAFT_923795 [Suillus clintonianus]|uniref:uncharacterized protein n=1 Tax=Suillus clintonianus TaxID=1904413 RepID=UPI001B875EAC|nr:uncharacterized protein DEU56DRAFT_923795 [Suillus clintonianus]KAG2123873.1 hypothetical protein DEU56DRAFT_923795 [Suillus clintonianus]
MDIAILAIPGLGATEPHKLYALALLFGVGCIFAGTMLYYLQRKTKMFIVITGIPTSFCVLSVTGSILGFLSGVVTDFKPSAPVMIASLTTLGIVNFHNNEQGQNVILQIQQYAGRWAIRGIVTVVFTKDDVGPYALLRKSATLMEVRSVQNLDWAMAKRTSLCRRPDTENVDSVVHVVGGRTAYLNKVSRAEEMLQAAKDLFTKITTISCCNRWLLDKTFLSQVLHNSLHLPIKSAGELSEWIPGTYICRGHANLQVPPLSERSTSVLVCLLYITKTTCYALNVILLSCCIEPDELIDMINRPFQMSLLYHFSCRCLCGSRC